MQKKIDVRLRCEFKSLSLYLKAPKSSYSKMTKVQ